MTTLIAPTQAPRIEKALHRLESGDRMTRAEFHQVYEQMPESFHAELIGGIVYVASPVRLPHRKHNLRLGLVLGTYEAQTPGVEASENTTVLLGDEGEPQPDLLLRIRPDFGGQSRTTDDSYIAGPPELVAEIAHSSRAIDLHAKREDYRRYGVLEYLVVCIPEQEIRWFNLRADRELQVDGDGIIRVQTFPGLWINPTALFADDAASLLATVNLGLATPEHADFVRALAARKTPQ
jgi:Uma2 family endonuclease